MSAPTTTGDAPVGTQEPRGGLPGIEIKPVPLLQLALAGTRTDTLRVLLTAVSAALAAVAALAALTVLAIPAPHGLGPADGSDAWSRQYTNALLREPGLRPGVAFTLLLLTIPVLALAGQCTRLGAPARERRLSAIRLAGGTPRQAVAVAATETGAAALLGSLAGLGIHLAGRALLHRPDEHGMLPLPTDVMLPVVAPIAVVVGIPLLAMAAAWVLMRPVTVSPFGVSRRSARRRAPRPWPGILVALGVGAYVLGLPLTALGGREDTGLPMWTLPVLVFGGALLATLGVVLGVAWVSHTAGRVLHRFARRPATLLAARQLMADPWSGSRTFGALLAAVVFGAGAAAVRAFFVARAEADDAMQRLSDTAAGRPHTPDPADGDFYLRSMDLVNTAVLVALVVAAGGLLVAFAESVLSRRHTHAALVATGVPRGVLSRAVAWRMLAPAVPAIVLALTIGTLLGRGLGSEAKSGPWTVESCTPGREVCADDDGIRGRLVEIPEVVRVADFPLAEIGVLGVGALALVLATMGAGLLFLRTSTAPEELRTG
ncbi:hypothetical protein [Streptomyces sp. KR80]|uniref:hypothetical protein n=1 Tax=Streptomyces sp. KR80 TaxID=3457426 RepID=UPI003FD19128